MKIKWRKITSRIADGYVGKIRCFEIEKYKGAVTLICDLPSVTDNMSGRLITEHKTSREAAKAAETTLKHWIKRLRSDE